jgi:hypothetical protein
MQQLQSMLATQLERVGPFISAEERIRMNMDAARFESVFDDAVRSRFSVRLLPVLESDEDSVDMYCAAVPVLATPTVRSSTPNVMIGAEGDDDTSGAAPSPASLRELVTHWESAEAVDGYEDAASICNIDASVSPTRLPAGQADIEPHLTAPERSMLGLALYEASEWGSGSHDIRARILAAWERAVRICPHSATIWTAYLDHFVAKHVKNPSNSNRRLPAAADGPLSRLETSNAATHAARLGLRALADRATFAAPRHLPVWLTYSRAAEKTRFPDEEVRRILACGAQALGCASDDAARMLLVSEGMCGFDLDAHEDGRSASSPEPSDTDRTAPRPSALSPPHRPPPPGSLASTLPLWVFQLSFETRAFRRALSSARPDLSPEDADTISPALVLALAPFRTAVSSISDAYTTAAAAEAAAGLPPADPFHTPIMLAARCHLLLSDPAAACRLYEWLLRPLPAGGNRADDPSVYSEYVRALESHARLSSELEAVGADLPAKAPATILGLYKRALTHIRDPARVAILSETFLLHVRTEESDQAAVAEAESFVTGTFVRLAERGFASVSGQQDLSIAPQRAGAKRPARPQKPARNGPAERQAKRGQPQPCLERPAPSPLRHDRSSSTPPADEASNLISPPAAITPTSPARQPRPLTDGDAKTTLYVSSLPVSASPSDLAAFFAAQGVSLVGPHPVRMPRGQPSSRGFTNSARFAYVDCAASNADQALALSKSPFVGPDGFSSKIYVRPDRPDEYRRTDRPRPRTGARPIREAPNTERRPALGPLPAAAAPATDGPDVKNKEISSQDQFRALLGL